MFFFIDTVPSGDIIIEYGKPLDIYCVLNDDFVENNGPNSSLRLSFYRGNDPLPSEMVVLFQIDWFVVLMRTF